jgi:hypothetical membrane protein
MVDTSETAVRATTRTVSPSQSPWTRRLLVGGMVAGPLFLVVVLGEVLTRDGFDLRRHPISMLSVGNWGWIQMANFVVAGVLSFGFALAVRRTLHPGPGGTWGPLLLGLYGVGLVAGGLFAPDPALGFPPGAPEGIPTEITWHAAIHNVAPVLAFNAAITACFVFVRRFLGLRQSGWAAYSAVTGVVALGFAAWPTQVGISWRLVVAVVVIFAWQITFAAKLRRELGA